MEPQIKTQAKVLVKSNNENVDSSSRLNVVCDILPSVSIESVLFFILLEPILIINLIITIKRDKSKVKQ